MPDTCFDLLVIGGGLVGLASAREAIIRAPHRRVLLLEKEPAVARHQSGRNSGVIHSGIYYRPGSLKAHTCVEGRSDLMEFCREHAIPFELCGKVIVALQQEEIPALHELEKRGKANGIPDLTLIGPERLREIEPHAAGIRALHIPGSGIIDYSLVAKKIAADLGSRGGAILTSARVTGLRHRQESVIVESTAGAFESRLVVNCAGLHSDRVARMSGARPDIRILPFRGEYRELSERAGYLVKGMIYPVPDPDLPFLGVHLNRRVDGTVSAGPNAVLAFSREGYRKNQVSLRDMSSALGFPGFWKLLGRHWRHAAGELHRSINKGAFLRSLRSLVPELSGGDLRPGTAGVRAQAVDGAGRLIDDFRFVRTAGLTHVLNVPSPAATACLAIARRIMDLTER